MRPAHLHGRGNCMTRTLRYAHWTLTLALATVAAAGCTMKKTEVPALTGPS